MVRFAACALVLALAGLGPGCGASDPDPTSLGTGDGQWPHYAGDPGGSKYSPLDEIDAASFGRLEVAWVRESPDVALAERIRAKPRSQRFPIDLADFQVTPVMVDAALYGSTSLGQVFRLDAETGSLEWVHDPESYRFRTSPLTFLLSRHRGVAVRRGVVYMTTLDAFLLALDADTGEPVRGFGRDGRVDLLAGLRVDDPPTRLTDYFQTSPPAIYDDLVIVGSSIDDRPSGRPAVPGDVRAYDAGTGALRWTFHTIPEAGEPGAETWLEDAWRDNGAANVWGPITVDPELGLVFLTTSTPTNDFYGGHRPGDGLFGESLVALDAATGERRWHFQLVHHGLWDYDPGAAANLVDVVVDGKPVRAVAQVTKQGFTFVFDRVTGEPVWPIEERPVPRSDVPGERVSPSQPFPTRPPPFELQGAVEENLIDLSPALRADALAILRRYRSGPLYTPPSLAGTLILPGTPGGANWRGAGVDPDSGVLFVPSIRQAMLVSVKPGAGEPRGFRYESDRAEPLWLPDGSHGPDALPLFRPPWSSLTAIDLNRGEILWQTPVGGGPRDHPRLRDLDPPRLGSGAPTCVLVTKTLVMAGDGAHMLLPKHRRANRGQPLFHAFDKRTGALLGSVPVPGRIRGCPMTYRSRSGQRIVFSVGDREQPAALVALGLPD